MDEKKAPRKRLTKAELTEVLLKKVSDWIDGGDSPEDAVGKLTDKQYDFLIDQGVDFDNLLLTPEQLKNAQSIMGKQAGRNTCKDRAQRLCQPNARISVIWILR